MFSKNPYMEEAFRQAELAAAADEVPVGAVIVDSSGAILAACGNGGEKGFDPTAHAEIKAIREACRIKQTQRLEACDLYVTLEPCPMCAQAISFGRIRRLYFAAYDAKGGGVENGPRIFSSSSCHHRPEIYGGIGEEKAAAILKRYFLTKR